MPRCAWPTYAFEHQDRLGNAHDLSDRILVKRGEGVDAARAFTDDEVEVRRDGLPAQVRLLTRIG